MSALNRAWRSVIDTVENPARRVTLSSQKDFDTAAWPCSMLASEQLSEEQTAGPKPFPPIPRERWSAKKGESPPDFIRRVWHEWLEQEVLTRSILLHADRALYQAWGRWIRANNNKMPADLDLPRQYEKTDRTLAECGITNTNPKPSHQKIPDPKAYHRLYMAAWRRWG